MTTDLPILIEDQEHIQSMESLWTVDETARALRVSRSLVYRMANKGELPSLKISNRLRFNPADIEDWVYEQTRGV